ncbi:hypothetical protein D3C81_1531290 [compost metagenome]
MTGNLGSTSVRRMDAQSSQLGGLTAISSGLIQGLSQILAAIETSHADRIRPFSHNTLLRNCMSKELTKKEMRRPLFGGGEPLVQTSALPVQGTRDHGMRQSSPANSW